MKPSRLPSRSKITDQRRYSCLGLWYNNRLHSQVRLWILVREVAGDQIARRVVLLSDQAFGLANVKEVALGCGGVLNDIYRVFPYIVYAQLFALLTSLKVENKPDTPSPTGTVNRVVQGVIIHEYQK